MQIKKIQIQGFKSLENVIFEPETGFSCLVGSNGAGKSNFCDALNFFKKVVTHGVDAAIEQFGDKDLILSNQGIFISYDLRFIDANNINIYYQIKINIEDNSIVMEKLFLDDFESFNREDLLKEKFPIGGFMLEQQRNFFNSIISISSDKTYLSSISVFEEIVEQIHSLGIYRINPLTPKIPNKIFNKSNLLMYGENLATILSELKKDQEKWQILHDWLNLIVPSISEIRVLQGEFDQSLNLQFLEDDKPLPAISISDGTIYTLAILTAVLWNQDKNTLIVIEEPERGIHPQALVELISFMREATTHGLNIITTTHSETFVRNCKLEELWLVDKKQGKTQLKSAKNEHPHLTETTLDQAWLMNLFNGGLPW